ncbi:hypothetical protein ACS0TY_019853 [Phlomoides rotata]
MEMEGNSIEGVLLKVSLFIVVQALVYLILSQSSNVFSKAPKSDHTFRPARSLSIRRWAAALADIPAGGELSPSPKGLLRSLSRRD